ncbi:MAG: hypothetical protein AAF944_26475 [Bacteroidota bacterium]
MSTYPHNITVSSKPLWPWAARQVRIEDELYLKVARPFGLHWHRQVARNLSGNVIFSLRKKPTFSHNYLLEEVGRPAMRIRSVQAGYWVCESANNKVEVYRLGGSKSIITQNGCQIAIMSVQSSLMFIQGHPIRLRVNEKQYLHLSVAMSLLINDYGLHLSADILPQPKVSTLQTG